MEPNKDTRGTRFLPLVAGVAAVRLYSFGVVYLMFLNTALREERNDFVFRPEGGTLQDREREIRRNFWERLAPLDGQFYLDIAHHGYRTISSSIKGDLGNYAFFPLLPAMLAGVRAIWPKGYLPITIASIVSLATAGTVLVWKLAERCGTNAILAIAVLLCFPSAPFQYILYTEGIFLCLSAATLLCVVERRPALAILFACVSGLARPQGVLLSVPLFLSITLPGLKSSDAGRPVPLSAWIAPLAPLSGFVVLATVSSRVAGSPFAFLEVQGLWGRTFEAGGLLRAATMLFGYPGPPMDLLGVLVGFGCIPIMWKHLPRFLTFYGIAVVAMPLATGSFISFGRFMSVSIPHLLAIGIFLERRSLKARIVILGGLLVLQSLLARGLLAWYFVG